MATHLVHADGKPTENLLALASRHGIQTADGPTAQELSDRMQLMWLRTTNHQYQIRGGPPDRTDTMLLRSLGLVDEVGAPEGLYSGALILGATLIAVRRRIAHLVSWLNLGAHVEHIFLLGGARQLDAEREDLKALTTEAELSLKSGWTAQTIPKTEAEMMRFVFEQSVLPEHWSPVYVNAPLQTKSDGRKRNPNTRDTVLELLSQTKLLPGQYLAVSSQPFVQRQSREVQRLMPHNLVVVGTGYAALPTTPLKTYLDEVARLLFVELAEVV